MTMEAIDDASGFMERLMSDPEAFRARKREAERVMTDLLRDPPQQAVVEARVVLDGTLAPAYQIARTIFEAMTGRDEAEFVAHLVANAVMVEIAKMADVRNMIMGMGSIEALASQYGLDLSEPDRRTAAEETDVVATTDPSLMEYFRRGYVSTKCPRCKKRAVWHPDRHDLSCLDGCGPIGKFEERPGPNAEDR